MTTVQPWRGRLFHLPGPKDLKIWICLYIYPYELYMALIMQKTVFFQCHPIGYITYDYDSETWTKMPWDHLTDPQGHCECSKHSRETAALVTWETLYEPLAHSISVSTLDFKTVFWWCHIFTNLVFQQLLWGKPSTRRKTNMQKRSERGDVQSDSKI